MLVHFNRGVKSPRYFEEERKRDIIVDAARRKKISHCSFEGEIFCGHLLTSLDFGKDYGIKKLSPLKVSKLAAHFDLIREGSFKCVDNPACVNGEIKSLIRPPSPPIFLFSSFSSFSFATPSGKKNKLSPSPFDSPLPLCPKGGTRKGRKEEEEDQKILSHRTSPPPSHIQRPPPPFQTPALFTLHLKRGKSVFSSRLTSGRGCKNPPMQHTHSSIHIPRTILYGRTRNSSKDDDSIRKEPFFPALFFFSFFLGGRGDGGGPERRRRRNILSSLPLFFSPSRIRRRRRPPPP